MKTQTNDRKPHQALTQKQIIKELKCLIAKQQQEINKLIGQVERLKHERENDCQRINKNKSFAFSNLQSSRELENGSHEKLIFSKNSSSHASVIHSKNSTSREHQHKYQNPRIESVLKMFQKQIKQFTLKILQPFNYKYLGIQKKQKHQKLGQVSSPLEANFKDVNFENLKSFAGFFPLFLKQTKFIIQKMDQLIQQKQQNQLNLQKKMKEQEKTLKQMIKEYEHNIIDSQKMQSKLLAEIKRLKNSNLNKCFAQTIDFSQHDYK